MKKYSHLTFIVCICAAFGFIAATPVNAKSIWDQINDTAPRTIFDDIRDTAPRTIFDDIRDTAPVRAPDKDLAGE